MCTLTYVGIAVTVAAVLVGAALYGIERGRAEPVAAGPVVARPVVTGPVSESSEGETRSPSAPDREVADPAPIAPALVSPAPTAAAAAPPVSDVDLGLSVPLTVPACDGSGIVVIHSAISPGAYAQEVAAALASNPGARYLRTDRSCPSLRQQSTEGNPIYAVYRVSGYTTTELCNDVRLQGGDAYGKWLNTASDPALIVPC
ncbi:hypothetical protein A2J03_24140 [Rhodococcus sp. EPR-157]|nr:hypothetical protein A2J03_24140 [Rhodococcus sp. EPR-157]